MHASKENCRAALAILSTEGKKLLSQSEKFLQDFLTAAEAKLPGEAAYVAEQSRRKADTAPEEQNRRIRAKVRRPRPPEKGEHY